MRPASWRLQEEGACSDPGREVEGHQVEEPPFLHWALLGREVKLGMEGQPCHLGSQNGPCTLASEPPGDQDPRLLEAPTAAESEILGAGPSIFWPFSYTLTFVSPTQLDQGVLLCHWDQKPLLPTGLSHWLSNYVAEEIDTFPMACECVSRKSAHDCSPTNAVGPLFL